MRKAVCTCKLLSNASLGQILANAALEFRFDETINVFTNNLIFFFEFHKKFQNLSRKLPKEVTARVYVFVGLIHRHLIQQLENKLNHMYLNHR